MTDTPVTPVSERVPISGRLGFGLGEFGFVIVFQGASLFLMYFYTDIMGINPAVAGVIYLIALIWDAVIDPVVANIVDRTRSKMGRYRPWLLFGAIPFGLSYPLAFSNPDFIPVSVWVWALLTHVVFRTTYTIASMPYNSLQARLTPDSRERTVLAASRMIGAASAILAVSFITPVVVGGYGEEREAEGYFFVACLIGTITAVSLLTCFALVREPEETETKTEPVPFFKDLVSVIPMIARNEPFLRVLFAFIVASVALGMFGKNMLYHFKYDVQREDLTVIALISPAIMLILANPLWVKIAGMTSKRRAVQIGLAIGFVGYLGFFFNPSQNVGAALGFIVLNGFGMTAFFVLFWSMFADTLEYGELKTGICAEAKTFAFITFSQKAAVGVNALLLGTLLTVVGFDANADQTASTLFGMKAIMALIPAGALVIMFWLISGYTLDREAHAQIRAQLEARKAT